MDVYASEVNEKIHEADSWSECPKEECREGGNVRIPSDLSNSFACGAQLH